jgi:NTE family protein
MDQGPVTRIDAGRGYYPGNFVDSEDDALLVLTMSGGGERAAAFSQGMLDALGRIHFHRGTLLDEVDIVSSVSGGSVTAANDAVDGPGSIVRLLAAKRRCRSRSC